MDTDRTRLHGRKQVETTLEEFHGNLKRSISKTKRVNISLNHSKGAMVPLIGTRQKLGNG